MATTSKASESQKWVSNTLFEIKSQSLDGTKESSIEKTKTQRFRERLSRTTERFFSKFHYLFRQGLSLPCNFGAVTKMVPNLIWTHNFFGSQEIWAREVWAPRNLDPKKFELVSSTLTQKFL